MKKKFLAIFVALLLCASVSMTSCSFVVAPLLFDYAVNEYLDFDTDEKEPTSDEDDSEGGDESQTTDNGSKDTPTHTVSQTRPYYNMGSNKKLSDKIVVIFLFVDDNSDAWTYDEIATFMTEQARPALYYLVYEAEKWDVELWFELDFYSTPTHDIELKYEGDVGNGLNGNDMSMNVLENTATDMGYTSPEAMLSAHRAQYSNAEIAYVNVFNEAGRSYTCMQVGNPTQEYAEHCVLFADAYENAPRVAETRSATIAHEFLHLYGSEDFYTPDKRQALALLTYPNDIMLISATSLSDISISDVTAHMVGWNDTAPEICYNEAWRSDE